MTVDVLTSSGTRRCSLLGGYRANGPRGMQMEDHTGEFYCRKCKAWFPFSEFRIHD